MDDDYGYDEEQNEDPEFAPEEGWVELDLSDDASTSVERINEQLEPYGAQLEMGEAGLGMVFARIVARNE